MPAATTTHAEDLADFVDASPSSYHAAAEVARRLEDAGFTGVSFLLALTGSALAWAVAAADSPGGRSDGAVDVRSARRSSRIACSRSMSAASSASSSAAASSTPRSW